MGQLSRLVLATGYVGGAILLLLLLTKSNVMVEVWREQSYPNETRTIVMVMISILLGGGSLVLGHEDDPANQGIGIAKRVAIVALVALGVLVVLEASGSDIGPRWFGVASVLFFVPALSLPFCRLAGEESDAGR